MVKINVFRCQALVRLGLDILYPVFILFPNGRIIANSPAPFLDAQSDIVRRLIGIQGLIRRNNGLPDAVEFTDGQAVPAQEGFQFD